MITLDRGADLVLVPLDFSVYFIFFFNFLSSVGFLRRFLSTLHRAVALLFHRASDLMRISVSKLKSIPDDAVRGFT